MSTNPIRRSRRRSSPADQMHLPLDEADIRHNNKLLGVYRDHNAHHAIVVKIGKTRISFVEMKKGQLTTQSLPDTKFFGLRGFERIEGVPTYTSLGTGYWGPPMRLGSPPEIARIVLT